MRYLRLERPRAMPENELPEELLLALEKAARERAQAAFRRQFGESYFDTRASGTCSGDGGKSIPPELQEKLARKLWLLKPDPLTAGDRLVKRGSELTENLIVTFLVAVASLGAGVTAGHWWQDGWTKFHLFHPSLGSIIGGLLGLVLGMRVLDALHGSLSRSFQIARDREVALVACDALLSGYVTLPSVQEDILRVIAHAKQADGTYPKAVCEKIRDLRSSSALALELWQQVPQGL